MVNTMADDMLAQGPWALSQYKTVFPWYGDPML